MGVCSDTSICMQGDNNIVGLDSRIATKSRLTIFPNPTSGDLNVQGQIEGEHIIIEIRSVNGQLLSSKNIQAIDGEIKERMSLSACSKGVYLINIKSEKTQINKKLIIQ